MKSKYIEYKWKSGNLCHFVSYTSILFEALFRRHLHSLPDLPVYSFERGKPQFHAVLTSSWKL